MTLDRLIFAWIPVVVWCALGVWIKSRVTPDPHSRLMILGRAATEGALLTLFASLWFDSLGSGGWWLLFGLVGALVAMAGRTSTPASLVPPMRTAALLFLADLLRYIGAGAILAWRLGG